MYCQVSKERTGLCKEKPAKFKCDGSSADNVSAAATAVADEDFQSMAGVKMLAEAIDSIVMRVQVQLTNLVLRLEYVPSAEPRGMALELKIGSIK